MEQSRDSGDLYASRVLRWPVQVDNVDEKREMAARAAALVKDGETIGIGSGSAAYLALRAIADRVSAEDLTVWLLTSSYETETAALTLGLRTLPLGAVRPMWGVDGADEIDPTGRLLKGRGGAMFKEKILWNTAERMYLAADRGKRVERLGERFPVPIEVDRHAVDLLSRALDELGVDDFQLRLAGGKDGPVFTEAGNLIVDAHFRQVPDGLHAILKRLPGVVETGLFEGYSYEML